MQEILIGRSEAGGRLDKFLTRYFKEADHGFLYRMLRKKNITLNEKRAAGSERLTEGDRIQVFFSEETFLKMRGRPEKAALERKPLEIVFENEDILILNKPAGLLSQKANAGDDSLTDRVASYVLKSRSGDACSFVPAVANRLDRNTSGLVLAGKTLPGQQLLSWLLRSSQLDKYYLCFVKGELKEELSSSLYWQKEDESNKVFLRREPVPGSSLIRLSARPLESFPGGLELLKVKLISGKGHQIRAQLSYLGLPVLGDGKYGDAAFNRLMAEKLAIPLRHQLLHSYQIAFPAQIMTQELSPQAAALAGALAGQSFKADPPPHFQRVWEALGGNYGKSARP